MLLENVTGLSFEFFLPSDVNRSKVTTPASQVDKRRLRNPEAYNRWYQSWSMDYYMLPSIVKINLKRMNIENEEEDITFSFPLPNSRQVIFYLSKSPTRNRCRECWI